jgi:hypothetical protein
MSASELDVDGYRVLLLEMAEEWVRLADCLEGEIVEQRGAETALGHQASL